MDRAWSRVPLLEALLVATLLVGACGGDERPAETQTTSTAAPASTAPPATQPPTTQPAPPAAEAPQAPYTFTREELRELVAPVGLYPDIVLASLLPATTLPDQVGDAAAYLTAQGGRVEEAPTDRGWDGSVAALLQFPDLLTWLDQNDAWQEQMAVAVTHQQSEVLEEIQRFRRDTRKAGNLESNEYQNVTVEESPPAPAEEGAAAPAAEATSTVRIEPAQPDVVYVPQYNPTQVVQPAPAATTVSPWVNFGTGMLVGGMGAWAMYSIFDDDDWDDHYHGGGGHKQTINVHNNYYHQGNRPGWDQGPNRPGEWRPRPSQRPSQRPGGFTPARPTPYPGTGARPGTRPGGGQVGVRPPTRPGAGRPGSPVAGGRPAPPMAGAQPGRPGARPSQPIAGGAPARPTTRPAGATRAPKVAAPTKAPAVAREPAKVAKASGTRGQASMQGRKPTPSPRPQSRPQPAPQRQQPTARPAPRQESPAMRRSPSSSTRQHSNRGNQSLGRGSYGGGGGGGHRGGGGGGGGRGGGRGGGGGRRGR